MKAKLITLLFILSVISNSGFAQSKHMEGSYSGGHDSLVFDGADERAFNIQNETDDKCKIKVMDVFGEATGTYWVDSSFQTCGTGVVHQKVKVTGQLRKGVELIPGYELTTGGEGWKGANGRTYNNTIMLDLGPGTGFMLGRKASIMIGNDCAIQVNHGGIISTGDINVSTARSTVTHKNTQYSVEVIEDGDKITDIVKVYEGSVEFGPNMGSDANNKERENNIKKMSDLNVQLQKLSADYSNGKITAQEYSSQMQELSKEMSDAQSQLQRSVTVNAGYKSSITDTDKPTEPEQFDTNADRWWEDTEK
jgi:hypothetical protein